MNSNQCLLFFLLALTMTSQLEAEESATWSAGVASANITPKMPMWMAGYAHRDHPADGTLTELYAKALVLVDARGHRAVAITLDLIGIDGELSHLVCLQLKQQHGFDRHQIAILCSHTHSGPALRRNLAPIHYMLVDETQQQRIDAYTDALVSKLVALVTSALENVEPCQMRWGIGNATFAVNRRENSEEAASQRRRERTLVGPVDHSVPVLSIRNLAGDLKVVMFGYACHATVMSAYEWSGDYPGFAQLELEKLYPGCVAMFWAGCGADQNPLPRRTTELARHYGRQLAGAVDAVLLTSEQRDIQGDLSTTYSEIDLDFAEIPSAAQVAEDLKSSNRYTAARARLLQRQLDSGNVIPTKYSYPIATWQLGDELQWVLLGGEVVVDYAIQIKSKLPADSTWIAGYANDVMAYIPSRRVLLEGGYEGGDAMVYYGLPSAWAPDVEERIVAEVLSLARITEK